jgi:ABC-type sugar transport system permease subunit
MNFKPTLGKTITSILSGFIIAFLIILRTIFGNSISWFDFILRWIVVSIIIYLIWSLLQKEK